MAKQQVTEADIEESLKSLGGFGGLGTQKPRRDSPFGSEFSRKEAPKPAALTAPISPNPEESLPKKEAAAAPIPLIQKIEIEKTVPAKEEAEEERRGETPKKVEPRKRMLTEPLSEKKETLPKTETLPERITLQMSEEMRDSLNDIARQLQRLRREKGERITANTLMRVAIQGFIDSFDSKALGGVSSEEELLREVKKRR